MTLKQIAPLFFLLCFAFSCDKDDADTDPVNQFYDGRDTTASADQLVGVWSIFNVSVEGTVADVPINYDECGRDFIVFSENNRYSEYIFQNSSCFYDANSLNWVLEDGIILLSNQFNQSDEWVVTTLNSDELIFKSKFDFDQDGAKDVVTLYLQHYTPIEIDIVTNTFWRNDDAAFDNLISFKWEPYQGFNTFNRYEIYRSTGVNCSIDSAELIATFVDVNTSEYTDLTPPSESYLCYYLKVYTDQGLLGESVGVTVDTENIWPMPVTLHEPNVVNTSIQFSWEPSNDPYFSHYELAFSNFGPGTASAQQEYSVATFYDRNITSYLDETPPYLENPFYVLYVYNIFGVKTQFYNSQVTTFREVDFKRDDIIGLKSVQSYLVDNDASIVYFYGKQSGVQNTTNIQRFNYNTKQTEAVANLVPQSSTNIPIKLIDSGYGKEIIIEQGSNLAVYNAVTLNYKYTLDPGVIGVNDFVYSNLGYWIITDGDDVYTFKRDNSNFELIDTKPHFPNHQASFNYKLFTLNNNKVLLGHYNENSSYLYNLGTDGSLVQDQIVSIPILSNWNNKTQYNAASNYIINFSENRLYSTINYSLLESFGEPYFSSGTSLNGQMIFGSNNDPDWQINAESIHAKEAVIFNRITGLTDTVSTIGYPQVIFENSSGEVISISSGLKKNGINQNINNKADLFLEIIDVP